MGTVEIVGVRTNGTFVGALDDPITVGRNNLVPVSMSSERPLTRLKVDLVTTLTEISPVLLTELPHPSPSTVRGGAPSDADGSDTSQRPGGASRC